MQDKHLLLRLSSKEVLHFREGKEVILCIKRQEGNRASISKVNQ